MRWVTSRVMALMLALLLLAACADNAGDTANTSTGDEPVVAEETATPRPEAKPSPSKSGDLTPDAENGDDGDAVPTPDPEAVDEWLETAPTFQGVAQGPDGELYVGHPPHAALLVLSPDGELIDAWGEEVRVPSEIEVDDGTVYVVDHGMVQKYDSDGTHRGSVGEFGFEEGQIVEASSLAIGNDGSLFISDASRVRLMHFSPEGEFIDERAEYEDGSGPPLLIEIDPSGELYTLDPVGDSPPFRMEKRSTDLEIIDEWDVQVMEQAEAALDDPAVDDDLMALPVAMDSGPDDRLYILSALVVSGSDAPEHGILDLQMLVYEPGGELVDSWLAESDSDLDRPLPQPGGMIVTADGEVIVVDSTPQTHRMLRFTADGEYLDTWEPDAQPFLCDLDPDAFQGLSCG